MSVRPVAFNADGSIDVVFDEQGHSGTIPAAEIVWATNTLDGSDNHNYIVLNCPDGCGASSVHPVGGGAAPAMVQEMFTRKVYADGCVCTDMKQRNVMTPQAAVDHVKELVEAMDGPDRWQVDEDALLGREPSHA